MPKTTGTIRSVTSVICGVAVRRAQPGGNQREVVEGGAVVFVGIVLVGAVFQERVEVLGVNGLIGVHRPQTEPWRSDGQRPERHDQNQEPV